MQTNPSVKRRGICLAVLALTSTLTTAYAPPGGEQIEGFAIPPILPGTKWQLHEPDRPQPPRQRDGGVGACLPLHVGGYSFVATAIESESEYSFTIFAAAAALVVTHNPRTPSGTKLNAIEPRGTIRGIRVCE